MLERLMNPRILLLPPASVASFSLTVGSALGGYSEDLSTGKPDGP